MAEGNLVSVLRHSDSSGNPEWWLIRANGSTGYVPESYLSPAGDNDSEKESDDDGYDNQNGVVNNVTTEVTDKNTSEVKTTAPLYYCADFAFEANSAAELSLDEGQIVVVLHKQDLTGNEEWWLVEGHGQKGYVPSSYLTQVED